MRINPHNFATFLGAQQTCRSEDHLLRNPGLQDLLVLLIFIAYINLLCR